ncbi:MAG: NAD(P)H-quinone oxidoreductase [Alphaproteobacteria bacterium]|nr:MAG: NAD(P)H-quinone oxidoreductase [Alphaproteobacteria bacterium]
MKAIEIREPGGPEVLQPVERPRPTPGPGEVLIQVTAAGVNRPDVFQRLGMYPPPPGASDLPGLEVAGTVVETGPETRRFHPGDKVVALLAGGGYAEYALAPEATTLPAPKGLPLEEVAGLPETVFTVWSNVFERAHLDHGEWLLVHGGASGIGTTAIQLAKAFDAHVVVTAGSEEKCRICEELGADLAINYRREDFVERVKEVTEGRGVDVVLDMVGGDYIPRNIACLAEDGRHVSIAFLRGPKAEVNFVPVMRRRLTLTGSTLRPRPLAFKAALAQEIERLVWPLIEAGRIRPVIDSRFPLERAADAHRRMESGEHVGKILLLAS